MNERELTLGEKLYRRDMAISNLRGWQQCLANLRTGLNYMATDIDLKVAEYSVGDALDTLWAEQTRVDEHVLACPAEANSTKPEVHEYFSPRQPETAGSLSTRLYHARWNLQTAQGSFNRVRAKGWHSDDERTRLFRCLDDAWKAQNDLAAHLAKPNLPQMLAA